MRKPLISGNWKMNLNHFEALTLIEKLSYGLPKELYDAVDITVHPPFTDLRTVQTVVLADSLRIMLGAQHCHWETSGAYTGEISAVFLAKLGVQYVICGHSERRTLFAETDAMVRDKFVAIQANAMTPILCVGESLDEREAGATRTRITEQVTAALEGRSADQVAAAVIAYEPIWAIGTGRTASPEDAQEVCGAIRALVAERWGPDTGAAVRIQYGGSVNAGNAAELLAMPDIDGALVGGASLVAEDFSAIVLAAAETR